MEIELNNVSYKKYLKNINIIFKSQLINGIIGPSGSGKTCLLELIDLLIVPTKGNVYIDKVIFNKTSNINEIRKNIGFVFQFPEEQFFNTTVKKELEVALNFYGYKKINK
ncbi:MAG: energy-coupling factor ABC transporter ATP-binding protein [Bacilli bacterium]